MPSDSEKYLSNYTIRCLCLYAMFNISTHRIIEDLLLVLFCFSVQWCKSVMIEARNVIKIMTLLLSTDLRRKRLIKRHYPSDQPDLSGRCLVQPK